MIISELKIIDNDLCVVSMNDAKIIHRHRPFSKIVEFKKVNDNYIVVREDTKNYDTKKSNIYCLNDDLVLKWYSDLPLEKDSYPNPILWNKEINDHGTSWDNYVIDNIDTLTCSSWKGVTVSIKYKTGKITTSIFTK